MVTKGISMFVHTSFKMSCLESNEWAAYYSLLRKEIKVILFIVLAN